MGATLGVSGIRPDEEKTRAYCNVRAGGPRATIDGFFDNPRAYTARRGARCRRLAEAYPLAAVRPGPRPAGLAAGPAHRLDSAWESVRLGGAPLPTHARRGPAMSPIDTLTRLIARVTRKPMRLLLPAGIAGAMWGFVELAEQVLEGETESIDRALILALRSADDPSDPLGPPWFEEMMRDFTALGGMAVLTFMALAAAGYLLLVRKRRTALLLLLSCTGGIVLSSLLKLGFDRPRPDLVSHGSVVYTASFPSGHSMMAATVYLTLGALLASVEPDYRTKIFLLSVALVLTVLVGVSRVYLGVHWPTDVLAGWMAGAAWALLLWAVALVLERRWGE